MPGPTFILVHGAWGGAWSWRDLTAEFDRRGVAWVALDLPSSRNGADPSSDLSVDATSVAHVAASFESVVLVGHSYGGAVVTEAASGVAGLERVVYIAALVPRQGQSATSTSREVHTRTTLDEAIEVQGDFLRLDPALAAKALYSDCSLGQAQWATRQLSTQTISSFRSPRTSNDVPVPTLYIRCSLDQAVDPALQVVMAERCGTVASLESGHSPFLSQPLALCDLLLI